MARFYPLPFSPLYDFTAARAFKLNGVSYQPGDPVDKEDVPARKLEQLYANRMIRPTAPESLSPEASKPEADSPAPPPPEKGENPAAGEGDVPPASTPPAEGQTEPTGQNSGRAVRFEHRGFGRYYLFDGDGKEIGGPLTKAQAQETVANAAEGGQ